MNHAYQMREAVLLTFCDHESGSASSPFTLLQHLSDKEWQRLLYWLDISGLALYFLDRLQQLERTDVLPAKVHRRLQQNCVDNQAKISAMIAESAAIHRSFQSAGFSYATLKGFSLGALSVPRPELRSQMDLDFLLAEEHANDAAEILEARGYYLHAISGRSWEFKADQNGPHTLKDLYKPTPHRAAELHLESRCIGSASLLARTEKLCFHGVCMPVLSPVDLFLGQAMHLFKHLSGKSTRAAHLIELRRHVIARYHQDVFWRELQALAQRNSNAPFALGFVLLLIEHVMGAFAPETLTTWTIDKLPPAARLWIDMYAPHTVYRGPGGSKLYLLLERELKHQGGGNPAKRSLRQALLPLRLPPAIVRAEPGETLTSRIMRYKRQINFIGFRLRIHTVEGLRYLVESIRWRRRLTKLGQSANTS